MKKFETGSQVRWQWGSGEGEGIVQEVFTEEVTKIIKGSEVTRDATEENPAYLIEQSDGDEVLKSHSEIEGK